MPPFTNIPYPAVPPYPGVPPLNRLISELTQTPSPTGGVVINMPPIGVGSDDDETQAPLGSPAITPQTQQWGVFDANNNPIWSNPDSTAVLSCFSLDFVRETRVADFPMQVTPQAPIASLEVVAPTSGTQTTSFTSYNKVQLPATPKVVLALDGQESDRTSFLAAIDNACTSTALYNIVTPTATYVGYTIERYDYARKSSRGVTLLNVTLSLKEIRQVTAALSNSPINNPQDPAATPQVNGGIQQPGAAQQSLLLQGANAVKSGVATLFQFGQGLAESQ